MRRILAATLLALAVATTPASAAECASKVDCARENVLRAVDCAVKLQPPCIYY